MSAALKQKAPVSTPTPFPTPERAALAHAISAATDADARKAALAQAAATADTDVRAARRAVAAAAEAIETAKSNAVRHLTDIARGTAGEAPVTIRQACAARDEAAAHLEACLAARDALRVEMAAGNDWSALQVQDAAVAVLRAELAGRGVALTARVAELQRKLVAAGSALEWLSRAGVFREPGGRHGEAADDNIRHAVQRMESTPNQWATVLERPGNVPFAQPTGAIAWQAAFGALKRDATAALPED
jgi:hypothetical protein